MLTYQATLTLNHHLLSHGIYSHIRMFLNCRLSRIQINYFNSLIRKIPSCYKLIKYLKDYEPQSNLSNPKPEDVIYMSHKVTFPFSRLWNISINHWL